MTQANSVHSTPPTNTSAIDDPQSTPPVAAMSEAAPVAPAGAAPTRLLGEVEGRHYALYSRNSKKPLVRVVPDDRWPGMWRMIWPDGQQSDMANLSRIKDAAVDICQRSAPGKDRLRFHWKIAPELEVKTPFHGRPAMTNRRARERLRRAGAESTPAMQRRVQALAVERSIPPPGYAKLMYKRVSTKAVIDFCEKHDVSTDWLLYGDLAGLKRMTRPPRRPAVPSTMALKAKIMSLAPDHYEVVMKEIDRMLAERGAETDDDGSAA
jgi:hypothetical protein